MPKRRLRRGLTMLLVICLALPLAIALADTEDAAEMAAYWAIVGGEAADEPLTCAMNGDYAKLDDSAKASALAELKAVTRDDLLRFAAAYKLPVDMARYAWYSALADCLAADVPATETGQRLALFLAMKTAPRDEAARQERRALRKSLTEADINAYAAETGLPAGFLAWLMLDDEWHEADWEDSDDWREGRRDWSFADWADASDLRERYGKEAVVTEDDVERVLRQNGYRFDD